MRSLSEKGLIFFWSRVVKTETCWLWTGSKSSYGYGQFFFDRKKSAAHRDAYNFAYGEIPKGLELDHLCRVRHCVRPEHLEAVTPYENMRRGFCPTAKNIRKTHCIYGHEFSKENTKIERGGVRRCRICYRAKYERLNEARTQKSREERAKQGILLKMRTKDGYTHCLRGHEMTPQNTATYSGSRSCRRCRDDAQKAYNERRRAKAKAKRQSQT